MSQVPRKIRDAVYERDGQMCVACGSTSNLTLQHRKNRGMGGSKLLDTPQNLIVLCAVENQLLESDPLFAYDGRGKGFKLFSYLEPLDCPVMYWDGWYGLAEDGTRYWWEKPVPAMNDDSPF